MDRDSKRIKEAISLLETFLQVVKNEHEMFFLGITRRPPEAKVRDLKRMVRDLEETTITNTAMQFQVRRLRARFNSYSTLWTRTVKQIEEGTYHRQRYMADAREKARQGKPPTADTGDVKAQIRALIRGDDPPEDDGTATVRDEPTVPDAAGRRKPAAAKGSGSGAAGHTIGSRSLLDEYNGVRARTGGKGQVSSDQLSQVLKRQEAAIKQKTGAREVRFRVVAEDGKPKIKAILVK